MHTSEECGENKTLSVIHVHFTTQYFQNCKLHVQSPVVPLLLFSDRTYSQSFQDRELVFMYQVIKYGVSSKDGQQ